MQLPIDIMGVLLEENKFRRVGKGIFGVRFGLRWLKGLRGFS